MATWLCRPASLIVFAYISPPFLFIIMSDLESSNSDVETSSESDNSLSRRVRNIALDGHHSDEANSGDESDLNLPLPTVMPSERATIEEFRRVSSLTAVLGHQLTTWTYFCRLAGDIRSRINSCDWPLPKWRRRTVALKRHLRRSQGANPMPNPERPLPFSPTSTTSPLLLAKQLWWSHAD